MISYQDLLLTNEQALDIAKHHFGITGEVTKLDGYEDFNFRIKSTDASYILKVSRPNEDEGYLDFQQKLIQHIATANASIMAPKVVKSTDGNTLSSFVDETGNKRFVRMLTWVSGRLWSGVNPHTKELRLELGELCGKMTNALASFDHSQAKREFDWDTAQVAWVKEHFHRFSGTELEILNYYQDKFDGFQKLYSTLPKSVVHADPNDNNIVVSSDLKNPKVLALIDYGDAIYTQTINDISVAGAYLIMYGSDPLKSIAEFLEGYNRHYNFSDDELKCLYTLIASRLSIIVTKASMSRELEPENEYLWISEKPAWSALHKWIKINSELAYFTFRNACGLTPHPSELRIENWLESNKIDLKILFPTLNKSHFTNVDMSVSSKWLGNRSEFENEALTAFKLSQLQSDFPEAIIAGGYLETRPLYTTNAYRSEGNSGYEYRNTHLGVDYWLDAGTAINAPFDGEVITLFDNNIDKDYGPTVMLKHEINGASFYTLYGHLSRSCFTHLKLNQRVKQGEKIAEVGDSSVNGNWTPHLHFQIILDLLGNAINYPGTCIWSHKSVWSSICPNPNSIFKNNTLNQTEEIDSKTLTEYRKEHLGKSLSLSYETPLHIIRGEGAHLIDTTGRKYLDTVNNVAHVGHEHPRVVKAGQQQMGLLNTNTRYLNENINAFAEELLATFPDELSVVHFVNSGSEANELALRMAKACTGKKDTIAVEIGYHGNANACIDISSYKFDGKGGKGKPEFTQIVPLPDSFRGIYQGEATGEKYASHVQEAIEEIQSKGRNVAAFITEPIISCGGQIELPSGYLKHAYKSVRAAGGFCISDEVQVGFGRLGKAFWGFELHGVVPDIVTVGKPIGNGHPMAAVICTKEVAEKFANGMEYFNTFGGNPVSSAIGAEVLRVVKDENLQDKALEIGNSLKSQLTELSKQFPIIGDVRGEGFFLGIELVDENKIPLPDHANYLANRMKEMGILMSVDGPEYNVLKIKPPMVFSHENALELISRMMVVFGEDFMQS